MLFALVWRDPGISEQEWADTPLTVRTAIIALRQQVRDVLGFLAEVCRGVLSGEVRAHLTPTLPGRTPPERLPREVPATDNGSGNDLSPSPPAPPTQRRPPPDPLFLTLFYTPVSPPISHLPDAPFRHYSDRDHDDGHPSNRTHTHATLLPEQHTTDAEFNCVGGHFLNRIQERSGYQFGGSNWQPTRLFVAADV